MKKIALGVVVFLGSLAGLELIFRLSAVFLHWPGTDSTQNDLLNQNKLWQNQLFSSFLGVQQSDPLLLWKFKPYLHRDIFVTNSKGTLGPEFKTEKPAGKYRILLIGDSSPVGLGLPSRKYAFGEEFVGLLKESYPGKNIELINASVSGYTSAQGLIWFEKYGVKLKPDLLLVYFGNNDASYNGFAEDKEFLPRSLWLSDLQSLLGRLALYQTLRGLLLPLKEKLQIRGRTGSEQLKVRVTPEDYYKNLDQIIRSASKAGTEVMLVTVPVPREWPPAVEFRPFVNLKTVTGDLVMAPQSRKVLSSEIAYCLDWAEIKQKYPRIDYWTLNVLMQVYSDSGKVDSGIAKYNEKLSLDPKNEIYLNNLAVLYWREKDYIRSLQYITRAIGQDSSNAIWHYNLGMIEKKLGDTLSAQAEFEKAKELDSYSLRTKNAYNQRIRQLAKEHSLPVVDLDSLFLASNNEFLFIDHCHPKPEGHRLMAQALLDRLKQTGWLAKLAGN